MNEENDDQLLDLITNDSFPLLPTRLPKSYYILLISLSLSMFSFQNFAENNFLPFMAIFFVKSKWHFSEAKAAGLLSIAGLAYIFVRIICIFVSLKITPISMLYSSITIVYTSQF